MSWRGRTWAQIGRKMVNLLPLARQKVAPGDSVLGVLSKNPDPGLNTTYREWIQEAFQDQYWNSPGRVIQFDAASAPMKIADQQDPRTFKLNNGRGTVKVKGSAGLSRRRVHPDGGKLRLLFRPGRSSIRPPWFPMTPRTISTWKENRTQSEEQRGLQIFLNEGRCIQCHGGSLFTNAAIDVVQALMMWRRKA